jgi:hypothetical protein
VAIELFDLAAQLLERRSSLNRLESRGKLRLTLNDAGLDAKSITLEQLRAVFEQRMPDELKECGIRDAAVLAKALWDEIEGNPVVCSLKSAATLDQIFRRLGGD